MKNIFKKIYSKKGAIITIDSMVWIVVFLGLLLGGMEVFRHIQRIQDTKSIAQSIARQVSLRGAVDSNIDSFINELERAYNMDVQVNVDGNYIGGTRKLQLETPFTVTVTYHTNFKIGIIKLKEGMVYSARAVGTSEKYH